MKDLKEKFALGVEALLFWEMEFCKHGIHVVIRRGRQWEIFMVYERMNRHVHTKKLLFWVVMFILKLPRHSRGVWAQKNCNQVDSRLQHHHLLLPRC